MGGGALCRGGGALCRGGGALLRGGCTCRERRNHKGREAGSLAGRNSCAWNSRTDFMLNFFLPMDKTGNIKHCPWILGVYIIQWKQKCSNM